ncbi:unnamed protein product [Durusdinium trenchii]|uniref:Pentatricopeptide repeat-containing protein n=2 Tax=Durusdinium trenchii TaxID=1381693 RepID=A0ABP0I7I7_9DINO
MALKRWAVRQISGLLSDYLEGITEQNLQASLSLEVGEVEIRHVRIHSELLHDQRLQLLSSDVSVSARIPWRNLGSEATVITVRDVWVEVKPEEPGSVEAKEAAEELQRWRSRRRRKVEVQMERARAVADQEEDNQPRRGMAARFGHAALRQLQVQVDGLRGRVHPKAPAYPVMELSILRLALHEGHASPERLNEVPKEVQRHPASLDKILELAGLCAQLSNPTGLAFQHRSDKGQTRARSVYRRC